MDIRDGNIVADEFCVEGVDPRLVSALVLHESDGPILQYQTPALGISHNGPDVCVCLTGFCLHSQDLANYTEYQQQLDCGNPCEIVCQLEECLLTLVLDKEDKAAFSYRDTSITFRKPDKDWIDKLIERYKMKCAAQCNPGYSSRRWRIPLCQRY